MIYGDYKSLDIKFDQQKYPYALYGRSQVGASFLLSYNFMISLGVGYTIYIPDEKNLLHSVPFSLSFHF